MKVVLWVVICAFSLLVGGATGLVFFTGCLVLWLVKKQLDKRKETYEIKSHTVSPEVHLSENEITGSTDNYKNLNDWESDLTTAWAGVCDIEFTYEKRDSSRSRRKVKLLEVCIDRKSRVYLKGFDHGRDDKRTFNTDKITTKILIKNKRYDIDDFLEEVLGLDVGHLEFGFSR